jgi:hypothetical protein
MFWLLIKGWRITKKGETKVNLQTSWRLEE